MKRYPGSTLHQIAPYLGKIRPPLARQLIQTFSTEGDWVWDPFCGSGTVPLECRLLRRNVVAADVNPYACILTRAKLTAPTSSTDGLRELKSTLQMIEEGSSPTSLDYTPAWVRQFFHEKTLEQTISLMIHFHKRKQYFAMGCLLGILHHQRPGFLSYPASHVVPYLRDRLYPRHKYPDAYEYRNPIPRLTMKIERVLKFPPFPGDITYRVLQKSATSKYLRDASIDTIITSPPYMNALDYARDNRLRLWFLGVNDYKEIERAEIRRITTFRLDMSLVLKILSRVLKPGGRCILILGDVKRSGSRQDVPRLIVDLLRDLRLGFWHEGEWSETIPDARRARKDGRATLKETVLIFRRGRGGYHG
jgi:DNA modification methylase